MIFDARRLWLLQLRLECKALDSDGRLVRIEGPRPDEIATCSIARFHDGYRVTFAATADDDLVDRVAALPEEMFFEDSMRAASAMGQGRAMNITKCSTYVFPEVLRPVDPAIVRKGYEEFAITVDDREVSWASSSRSNSEAAELWVWTDENARRSGYGQQVSKAWASEVTGEGRVAFYSHLDDNQPCRRLASKLGVVHLFGLANFTIEG
ncbi:GNAT family N-acetyltransferase [Actinopolymorpha alba]|uniref:GNAT family N-acetyltransferase n=1 Tax=Actinopolymorpha alba TaxID=533267 RepID=UPI00036D9645|nr:hypothetical protein [Actinopolymorpha alba]